MEVTYTLYLLFSNKKVKQGLKTSSSIVYPPTAQFGMKI